MNFSLTMRQVIKKPKNPNNNEGSIYLKISKVISTSNDFPTNNTPFLEAPENTETNTKQALKKIHRGLLGLSEILNDTPSNTAIPGLTSYTKPIDVNRLIYTNAKNAVDKFNNITSWEK